MSGWFASRPECPVALPTRDWIEQRWAWLTAQFGLAQLRSARVILPSADFFPDSYTGTIEDARVILDRVCGYMSIAPEEVELSLYQDPNPVPDGEWRQGTAGLYYEEEGQFRVCIEKRNLDDPLGLVATMAHELGHIHLLGHGRVSPDVEDHEPLTDLLTVYLGMGVFTANAVIREHYWHAGAEGGWSMGRRGYLTMPMYGYALARFAHARAEEHPAWAKHLRTDVRSAFTKACRLLAEAELANFAPAPETPHPHEGPSAETDEPAPGPVGVNRASCSAEELLERYACGDRDFRNLDLGGLDLSGADLTGSDLAGADLSEADLTDAVLSGSDLREADLQGALLCGTTLRDANLSEADLSGADLAGGDLSGADIRGADFTGGFLDGTVLVGTVRNDATDFSDVDLSQVECDGDLNRENLRGVMLSDRLAAGREGMERSMGWFLFVSLTMLLGALLGCLAGALLEAGLGAKGLTDAAGAAGATLSGVWSVLHLIQRRRQARANGDDIVDE